MSSGKKRVIFHSDLDQWLLAYPASVASGTSISVFLLVVLTLPVGKLASLPGVAAALFATTLLSVMLLPLTFVVALPFAAVASLALDRLRWQGRAPFVAAGVLCSTWTIGIIDFFASPGWAADVFGATWPELTHAAAAFAFAGAFAGWQFRLIWRRPPSAIHRISPSSEP